MFIKFSIGNQTASCIAAFYLNLALTRLSLMVPDRRGPQERHASVYCTASGTRRAIWLEIANFLYTPPVRGTSFK